MFFADYAMNYMKKLNEKLDENSFTEMLSIIQNFQIDDCDLKEEYKKVETILKNNDDLLDEFLGFLEPYQAFECGKLIEYYEIQNMKQFVRNLMVTEDLRILSPTLWSNGSINRIFFTVALQKTTQLTQENYRQIVLFSRTRKRST